MSSPIRLSPIAPPSVPSFARIAKASEQSTVHGKASHSSPGFSLNMDAAGTQSHTSPAEAAGGFPGMLMNQVQGVHSMQTNANAMVNTMLTGGDVNEAEVLTSVQKADLAFRMLLQIRNKLMEAYREIQQIQI